jgi:hypothetical protein
LHAKADGLGRAANAAKAADMVVVLSTFMARLLLDNQAGVGKNRQQAA